jgi:hypothetical protein
MQPQVSTWSMDHFIAHFGSASVENKIKAKK